MPSPTRSTQCCIAGGGPAGMMLGFLLARQGVDVTVLEKYPDFFRDFRGDTIHPSTMQVLHELGLLAEFLKLPHTEARELAGMLGPNEVVLADFSHLKGPAPFIAFMPQWDFLTFITTHARQYPHFHLLMHTAATGLLKTGGEVGGVRAQGPDGPMEIHADLVVAADGRHSTLREKCGMTPISSGAPMDVLWFRLSRQPSDPTLTFGRIDHGQMTVLIDRGAYWQCALLIRKGDFNSLQTQGLPALRARIATLLPWTSSRLHELDEWEKIKLLTVTVDHLEHWHQPGLLLIGDAAHAMSPVGGVGINLAIQDAVAAANILAPAFQQGKPQPRDLHQVQQRRMLPARLTQRLQVFIQNRLIRRVLANEFQSDRLPWPMRLLQTFPVLRRIPARIIGIGFRPEHARPATQPAPAADYQQT
jgi:2-polyprenyl-6-methoxyphenol hydroxylase-like FAD-dependent oxidoreductase